MIRHLCVHVILLTLFVPLCLPFKQDENFENTLDVNNSLEVIEKADLLIQKLNESDFKQPATECFEGGDCFQAEENKCLTKPNYCGNGTDVKCVYREEEDLSVCVCDNKTKKFDGEDCRISCYTRSDCKYGLCTNVKHDGMLMGRFCACYPGATGELCDDVYACKNVDCGDDFSAKCSLKSSGATYCRCINSAQVYDSVGKTCKDCNCGEKGMYCSYENGKKACLCPWKYYFDGDKCTDCNCGIGGEKCKQEDGTKICECFEGYAQRFDTCELCECGPNGGNCSFDELGKKQCDCEPGYLMAPSGFCAKKCNSTNQCLNGGTCDEVCQCPEGTSGDLCGTVNWCMYGRCGYWGDTECLYNSTSKGGYCKCKNRKSNYDDMFRKCDECDCGPNGECIIAFGSKVCVCEEGYADYLLKCKRCDCGYYSTNCSFSTGEDRICQCKEKYAQQTTKTWGEKYDRCAPCDCGDHGRCFFDGDTKVCDCEETYKVFDGKCKECDCGIFGYCDFDNSGMKVCHCDYGFSSYKGWCLTCNCDPPGEERIGSNCTRSDSFDYQICECPDGYKPDFGLCEDVNECRDYVSPCGSNTNCVNLRGSYKCECKKGFEQTEPGQDLKQFGCKDINECLEPSACFSSLTTCVNKPGSYDCVCKEGYYPNSASGGSSYNPKYASCNVETTQWKSASIVIGILLSLSVVLIVICICMRHST